MLALLAELDKKNPPQNADNMGFEKAAEMFYCSKYMGLVGNPIDRNTMLPGLILNIKAFHKILKLCTDKNRGWLIELVERYEKDEPLGLTKEEMDAVYKFEIIGNESKKGCPCCMDDIKKMRIIQYVFDLYYDTFRELIFREKKMTIKEIKANLALFQEHATFNCLQLEQYQPVKRLEPMMAHQDFQLKQMCIEMVKELPYWEQVKKEKMMIQISPLVNHFGIATNEQLIEWVKKLKSGVGYTINGSDLHWDDGGTTTPKNISVLTFQKIVPPFNCENEDPKVEPKNEIENKIKESCQELEMNTNVNDTIQLEILKYGLTHPDSVLEEALKTFQNVIRDYANDGPKVLESRSELIRIFQSRKK
jgi:hypothetical protein